MKVFVSELPKSHWWGNGVPTYLNNWAMQYNAVPDQKKVNNEYQQCLTVLQKHTELEVVPFPQELDTANTKKHDFIFVRDSFISNQQGDVVISNFSEKDRVDEARQIKKYLKQKGFRVHALSENAHAEGGEFYYIRNGNILFAGASRNNQAGVEETARLLGVNDLCIIESDSFHLDTIFTVVLDGDGKLCAMLAGLPLIKNKQAVIAFAKKYHVPLIPIDPIDTIDFDGKGNISVNCLPLPGVLIGGHHFSTPGVEEQIAKLPVTHVVTPITQFLFSAGGYHCLTNELLAN